ncbi:hypothetical protein MLD38_021450 [Melastoma candidum]|uniref:Uncharacterized protein n=1 Tax=Melastoma candidum TaxID=119954 RepID=A0ACB9QJH9_9MYRT|nr:hypothetical protein MLD38_021450 [Melastoma candidum]
MEVKVVRRPPLSQWMDSDTIGRTTRCSLQLPRRSQDLKRSEVLISVNRWPRKTSGYRRLIAVETSCSNNEFSASAVQSGSLGALGSLDECLVLKSKSQEVGPYLNGRCIFLVGMMGSGKTTVGKILSQVLGYSFVDCDTLVEQEAGGTSVADIFKLYGEGFFREKETEMLRRASTIPRSVVSTGGGAVMKHINWRYMHKGLSVWLDVPLDALAKRIAAVGTHSRPLLHSETGDAYTKAFNHLSSLFKERGEAYANANARVSLEEIAARHGYRDVSFITPAGIAIEALEQMEHFLKDMEGVPHDTL